MSERDVLAAGEVKHYSFGGVFAAKGADVLYVDGHRASMDEAQELLRELAAARAIVARLEDDRVMWEVVRALDRYPAKFVLDAYRARVRKGGEG